jgi:hypothetical protein
MSGDRVRLKDAPEIGGTLTGRYKVRGSFLANNEQLMYEVSLNATPLGAKLVLVDLPDLEPIADTAPLP